MKKLRCTSCGAELKVEDNKEYAVCEHCGSKYKLNEDLNINIKLDDNTKEVINNSFESVRHFSKFMYVPIIIFVIVFIAILFFGIKKADEFKKKQEDTHQKFEDEANKNTEESKRQLFNLKFANIAGTKNGVQVNNIIDDVIESNKMYDKKIEVVFNGNSTTEESKLIEIKHNIEEWDKYEVSINYDENKYVNEVKIDKVS